MNGNNVIRFADGTRLTKRTECTYLGHHTTQCKSLVNLGDKRVNVRQEVGQRMQQTMKTWFKLKPFSQAANCTLDGGFASIMR